MENDYFDKLIAEKLNHPDLSEAKPHWRKMRMLLLSEALKKNLLVWLLFPLLAVSLLFNGYYFLFNEKNNEQKIPPIVRNNHQINTSDTVVVTKTIFKTDTLIVYKYKEVPVPKNENAFAGTGYSGQAAIIASRNKMTQVKTYQQDVDSEIAGMKETNGVIHSEETNNPTELISDNLKHNTKDGKKYELPSILNGNDDTINGSASENEKNRVFAQTIPYGKQEPEEKGEEVRPEKRSKSKRKVRFQAGMTAGTGILTSSGYKGTVRFIGPQFGIMLNDFFGFYAAGQYLLYNYKKEINKDDEEPGYPSKPDNTYEVYTNNLLIDVPLGLQFVFPLGKNFTLNSRLGSAWSLYRRQQFKYEDEDRGGEHEISLTDTYSGFNQIELGLGASYVLRRKFIFRLMPSYRISIGKTGAEGIRCSWFTGQLVILYQF